MNCRFVASFVLLCTTSLATPAFDAWADELTTEWVRLDPQVATRIQFFAGHAQDAVDRELTPVTVAHRDRRDALARRWLTELEHRRSEATTAEQKVSADMMQWLLEDHLANRAFERHRFVFNQFFGLHVSLVNFLTQTHPIRHPRDIENYLARLEQVAIRLDEGIHEARAAVAEDLRPPRFIVERAREQVDALLQPLPAESVLVATLAERAARLPGVTEERRLEWVARAAQVVEGSVLPALNRVRELLQELEEQTDERAGLWRLPRGAEAYAQALRTFTTTARSPEEIHAIGRREVARIEMEMDVILRRLGQTDGSVLERYRAYNESIQPPAEPDPRPAILAEYTRIVREAEARAVAAFDLRPRAPVEVRREPAFTERTAAARYTLPAPDGSRPGIFWTPLPGPTFNLPRMRSLAYHEAVPGHHFQLALQQEMTSMPQFRRDRLLGGLSVYIEGWALYAERLADELGWYEGDDRGRLGYLDSQLFRARRLVVDTGLHAKQWTRQQAIDYGLSAQEVERYVVWPGQACSYMIGQLRLLELREQAQTALGARFSLREFHNLVLQTGAVPLEVLAEVIAEWSGGPRPAE